ncbi:MAG: twin-arginine translocase subunit TatC [Pyrinomonadaceae bacterium]|nr:twin-arginine translocase subunit TatC [Pyrinomonadaceae bacterium]
MSAVLGNQIVNEIPDPEPGRQMSFLEHLDEFRRRLVRSILFVGLAFCLCWYFSGTIFNFLARPTQEALAEVHRRDSPDGLTGDEKIIPLATLQEGDVGRYVFDVATKFGTNTVPAGATVASRIMPDANGNLQLFTDEPLFSGNAVIPKGVRLPLDLAAQPRTNFSADERMTVTTATESFTLYVTVSLYAAIGLSVPFLLWQIWGFIAPGLYPHERSYVTPFIGLSSISFVIGAAFAYYVLFPPAIKYLLGLGQDFRLMLRASDYFDFITLIMLAMGVVFQLPAVTYVFSRLGFVTAGMMIKVWRSAIVVILVVAAIVSPTADIPNMMLFAAPIFVLYAISIFVAWISAKKVVAV